MFSKNWWKVSSEQCCSPPAAPHRQAPAATGSQNLRFHAVIMCWTPCVLWFQVALEVIRLLGTNPHGGFGELCVLMALVRFHILQAFATSPCSVPENSCETQTSGVKPFKSYNMEHQALLVCCNFQFFVIPKGVTNGRAACRLRGFVSFKGVTSSRRYRLSLSWSSSSTSTCCDHPAVCCSLVGDIKSPKAKLLEVSRLQRLLVICAASWGSRSCSLAEESRHAPRLLDPNSRAATARQSWPHMLCYAQQHICRRCDFRGEFSAVYPEMTKRTCGKELLIPCY